MPPVCNLNNEEAAIWFKGYEQTYIERDIKEISQLSDSISLLKLLHFLAYRSSQILNTSEIARDVKLSTTTANRYLDLIEYGFVIHRLIPYLSNKTTRLIKSPKIYFCDTGFLNYITDFDKNTNSQYTFSGAITETFIFNNLKSIIETHLPSASLFFWNVQGRHEIDFIVENKNSTLAIEIKAAARWHSDDFKALKMFIENNKNCFAGILAYNGTQIFQIEEKIWAVPLAYLIS